MPKDEVPGPFYRPPKPVKWADQGGLSCLIKRMWEDEPVLVLRHHLSEAECDELVDLLNKGTYFELMLAALVDARDALNSIGATMGHKDPARHAINAAIAATRRFERYELDSAGQ